MNVFSSCLLTFMGGKYIAFGHCKEKMSEQEQGGIFTFLSNAI